MGKITRSGAIAYISECMEKRGIVMPLGVSALSEDMDVHVIWDSYDYVEMIYGVENDLGFTAEDEEWGKVETLGDFIDVITKYV
ncbi:MAG: acyl carrier protein [Alphaproteobacteria bacterium]